MAYFAAVRAFLAGKPWVAALLAMLALIAVTGLLWRCSVGDAADDAVQLDQAKVNAEASERVLEADRAATANQMARDADTANQTQELRDEAKKGDDRPVGDGVRSVLERMREQQNAGRR